MIWWGFFRLSAPTCDGTAAGMVILKKWHQIVILSFHKRVKEQAKRLYFFSVVMLSVFFKGFDQAESSDIHGFVGHAWDVKCPSILRLWISDVKTRCDFLRDDVGQFVRTTSLWPNHSIIVILLGSLLL